MTQQRPLDIPEFDRDSLMALFAVLDKKLGDRDFRGGLFIVGGAAMALEYSPLRVTTDIDAVFNPRIEIESVAQELAQELGLPSDWLNTSVSAMLTFFKDDENGRTVYEGDNLTISVASPEYLFALKAIAGRDKDRNDSVILAKSLNIHTVAAMQAVVERYYRGALVPGEYRSDVILSTLQDIEDLLKKP